MEYAIARPQTLPELQGEWDGPAWAGVTPLTISHFHSRSSNHQPRVRAKLLHDDTAVYVIFRVEDRHVRSVQVHAQGPVCTDSCVEFFVEPRTGGGYFNFEANAGGTFLLYYIQDHRRGADGFAKSVPVSGDWLRRLRVYHSLPAVVDPELPGPVTWVLEYAIPMALIEAYAGPLGSLSGQTWRGNFFKCADATSHPHWASWAPIGEALNFHQPDFFAPLRLL